MYSSFVLLLVNCQLVISVFCVNKRTYLLLFFCSFKANKIIRILINYIYVI